MTSTAQITELTTAHLPDDWSELDTRAVDTVRVLAADAVQKVGNGHPGTAMSLAPLAYTLFQKVMTHDPADDDWPGRDRFVLSAGHSSLTLYIQLYLAGFGLEIGDLEALRTWGSLTPGHPEVRHTRGVEITTGPLGQGLASAVGMAMAARRERGLWDPEAAPGESPFDHFIYVIASDGDIEEGITSEASSIAGRQQLGNLIVFYDHNQISIEDDTNIALSEDVAARYEAYGWHVQKVEGGENVTGILEAIENAKAVTDKPSFIQLHTIIGFPAPTKMNTGKAHGAALGADEIVSIKKILGFDPDKSFEVDDTVIKHTRLALDRGEAAKAEWQKKFDTWATANPEHKALFDRLVARDLPDGWTDALPSWPVDPKGIATRAASGAVLTAIGPALPELWGGSADLAESNLTTIKGSDSFGPADAATGEWKAQPYGRTLHFGIREHAMGAILSGIALHGPTRPYGGTFLQFSDYMRGAVRLAAVMGAPTVYVWTHDSIGLGEDGPDAPAGRAPGRPAGHSWAGDRAPGRCQRNGLRLEGNPGAAERLEHRAGRSGPVEAERPGTRRNQRRGRRQGCLRAGRRRRRPAGHHPVVRLGGADRVGRPRHPARRGHRHSRGLGAFASTGSRPRTRSTSRTCCRRRSPPGFRSKPPSPSRGGAGSAARADRFRSSTTAPRQTPRRSIASSASLRTQLLRPPRNHWPRRTLRTRSRTAPLLSRAQSKTSDVEPTRSRQGRS